MEVSPVIVGNGSGMMKSGFTGDCAPRAVYPSIIGRPKNKNVTLGLGQRDVYIGDEAQSKRGILNILNIISKGHIVSFDNYERLLHHNFYNELRIAPEEHPHIFSEVIDTTISEREKVTQIIFETFSIPAYFTSTDSQYCLYASGRITGVVLDSGAQVTTVSSIYNGELLPNTVQHGLIAGEEVRESLAQSLMRKGLFGPQITRSEWEILRDIKEKLCRFALDFNDLERENRESTYSYYELPDGNVIEIGDSRFQAPELIFKPWLRDIEDVSITDKIKSCINESYLFLHKELCGNILLSGGNTMFYRFEERLSNELKDQFQHKVKVICPPERKYSSWIGASIFSSLSTFQRTWMSKEEYEENGPSFIEFKCPSKFNFYPKKKSKDLKISMIEMMKNSKDISIQFFFQ